MGESAGHALTEVGTLVTREVRWFHDGSVTPDVLTWFTADGSLGFVEQRTDRYDLVSAALGLGVKHKGSEAFDVKYRIAVREHVELPGDLRGQVEDWVKVTMPLGPDVIDRVTAPIAVRKEIVTRRFFFPGLDTLDAGAGCDAEVASVEVGDLAAWSLCFETFGAPEVRESALLAGMEALVTETPLVRGMKITSSRSSGYPTWIASLGGRDVQEPRAESQ